MNFEVRITLPEAPEDNLARRIDMGGFVTDGRAPIPPKTEQDIIRDDLADHLVAVGIIPENRRTDLIFDFKSQE